MFDRFKSFRLEQAPPDVIGLNGKIIEIRITNPTDF